MTDGPPSSTGSLDQACSRKAFVPASNAVDTRLLQYLRYRVQTPPAPGRELVTRDAEQRPVRSSTTNSAHHWTTVAKRGASITGCLAKHHSKAGAYAPDMVAHRKACLFPVKNGCSGLHSANVRHECYTFRWHIEVIYSQSPARCQAKSGTGRPSPVDSIQTGNTTWGDSTPVWSAAPDPAGQAH